MNDNFCLIDGRKRYGERQARSPILPAFRLLLGLLLSGLLNIIFIVPGAHAAYCRTVENHDICILDIQRSAKNYWEYRARVSVDGVARPLAVYDCRDRVLIRSDGSRVPFRTDITGAVVCTLFRR